jgi:hypothetical protein
MYPRIHPSNLPNAKHLVCRERLFACCAFDRAPRADHD